MAFGPDFVCYLAARLCRRAAQEPPRYPSKLHTCTHFFSRVRSFCSRARPGLTRPPSCPDTDSDPPIQNHYGATQDLPGALQAPPPESPKRPRKPRNTSSENEKGRRVPRRACDVHDGGSWGTREGKREDLIAIDSIEQGQLIAANRS